VSAIALGGPGPGCSAMRLRRLAAGELAEPERLRLLEHLAGCARCQATRAELAEEQRQLGERLPFERFAAGVAERMAAPPVVPSGWRRLAPLALAATLLVALSLPFLATRERAPGEEIRLKGAAGLVLHADAPGGARPLAPGEPVPPAALRAVVRPGAWKEAALLLRDEDGLALLHAGPARAGPLPEAFHWTGREGELVLLLSEAPLSPAERDSLAAGAPPAGKAEVVRLPLHREAGR